MNYVRLHETWPIKQVLKKSHVKYKSLEGGQDGPYHSPDYQTSFESKGLLIQKKFNTEFQDGGRLDFYNKNNFTYFCSTSHLDTSNKISMIIANLDLQVTRYFLPSFK